MRAVPRLCIVYAGICLTTEENHGKPQSGYSKDARLISAKRDSFSRLGLLAPAALRFRVRRRGQPSVSVSICLVFRTRGFPTSARDQGSDVVGKGRNTQILVYLPVIYVPGSPAARRRHLDCNTCSPRTWVRAADLHAGHA